MGIKASAVILETSVLIGNQTSSQLLHWLSYITVQDTDLQSNADPKSALRQIT
jgi:hypothetical protein